MLRWPGLWLVLALALPACASHADSPRLCFEHVGLQGKPMPEFCIVRGVGSGDPVAPLARRVLVVSESTFDEVSHRCSTDRFDAASPEAGVYRWIRDDEKAVTGVVGPQTMRWIADSIRQDVLRRHEAVPDVILQLRRRLGTS